MPKDNHPAKAPKGGRKATITESVFVGSENHRYQVEMVEICCPPSITSKDLFSIHCQVRVIVGELAEIITKKLFAEEDVHE